MTIQSVTDPTPATEVKLSGETTIASLNKNIQQQWLSKIEGPLPIEAKIILTDEINDMDRLLIETSLKDVSIDMPYPLGKNEMSQKS